MLEFVLIKKETLDGIGDAIREKEGTDKLIPPLEMKSRILGLSGGGLKNVPEVTNIHLDNVGILYWDSPDIPLEEGTYFLTYVITVNDFVTEVQGTSLDVSSYLIDGDNHIKILTKVSYFSENDGQIIEFVMPEKIVVLSIDISNSTYNNTCCVVNDKVYFFDTGYKISSNNALYYRLYTIDSNNDTLSDTKVFYNTSYSTSICHMASVGDYIYIFIANKYIIKYNTIDGTSEEMSITSSNTIDTDSICVAHGNYIYFFNTTIMRFDTTTNTYTTLEVSTPKATKKGAGVAAGSLIYLIGGRTAVANQYATDTIYEFNTMTETVRTLDVTLPAKLNFLDACLIGNNIYIFGGKNEQNIPSDKIYKFNVMSGVITTLDITMPVALSDVRCGAVNNAAYIALGSDSSEAYTKVLKFTVGS